MPFSHIGERKESGMSMQSGLRCWTLAGATILLLAASAAGARVIDPTGVTTQEPAALTLFPQLKVDLNTCLENWDGIGFCSLSPDTLCTDDDDCRPQCRQGGCNLQQELMCSDASECPGAAVDTIVQLTNTSEFLAKLVCFYTNTNSHCSNSPETICTDANFRTQCPPGGLCVPGWVETDFHLTLTKRQPISWSVNEGLSALPLATMVGQNGQLNQGSIPPAPEVPFTGELLCVQVDIGAELPIDRNDFKGEATTITTIGPNIDARKYNAIGIKAIEGRQIDPVNVLNIGGPDAEYGVFNDTVDPPRFGGCPNVLTLNHFFDGAEVVTHERDVRGKVRSDLTVVPCERDYLNQTANGLFTTIQFLIFNEFEQRFSTSTKVNCYKETPLSDIDTVPGPGGNTTSIFSAGVQGTLTGMSRLRSVAGPNLDGYDGRTILALLTENWAAGICDNSLAQSGGIIKMPIIGTTLCTTSADCPLGPCINPFVKTTAANVQFQGSRIQGDRITIPLQ
jgi:hypothetical protein